jgi:hypothetical protein
MIKFNRLTSILIGRSKLDIISIRKLFSSVILSSPANNSNSLSENFKINFSNNFNIINLKIITKSFFNFLAINLMSLL